MKLTFHGAVRSVTGSMHLLEVNGCRLLLDCGLFQGRRAESNQRNRNLPFDPRAIDVVLLSHAHIDHAGNLPQIARQGFAGVVYTTRATRDLCSAMLADAAHIQQQDARFLNKRRKRGEELVEPLYSFEDVVRLMRHFRGIQYRTRLPVARGVEATFHDAGHILGSAVVVLDIQERGVRRRLGFTGDLGRRNRPILRDPERPQGFDVLITESTYGGRLHDPLEKTSDELAQVILEAVEHAGKVIVPSFAVGRTQELVYWITRLHEDGRIPAIPIFIDSPLAVDVTEIYRLHADCLDREVRELIEKGREATFGFRNLTYVRSVDDSKRLNERPGPMVVISASGMAETGRILHHLRNNIEEPRNTILIVGYQAHGTLGRRLVEKAPEVRIFGQPYPVRARVKVLNALSAHADQRELLGWILDRSDPDKQVFIVHGDADQSEALASELATGGARSVVVPDLGKEYPL